jgi:hypothetical protein
MYPYSIWGRAHRSIAGWDLSARIEACSKNAQSLVCQVLAVSDDGATRLYAQGTADTFTKTASCNKVTVAKRLLGNTLTVAPTYDFTSQEAEVGFVYSGLADTIFELDTTTKGPQMLTVSQKIGDNNRIIPSITTAGDVEIEYRRAVEGGMIAANLKPNKSVTLKWNDGPWLATLEAPMIGLEIYSSDVKIAFKRDVHLF